jgi:hypothetical protein
VGNEAIKEIGAASDRRVPEKVFARMAGRHFDYVFAAQTVSADRAASTAPASTRPSTGDNGHQPRQRTGAIVGLRRRRFAREGGAVLSVEFRRPEFSPKAAGRRLALASHDCVSWVFMAKPSINSTLTIKFSVRHAIERSITRATNETRAFQGLPKARILGRLLE